MICHELSLGEIVEPEPTVRAGGRDLPILSMTMRDGLVDQESKFKKRVASADTKDYKVVPRNRLVVGFPIDEGVLSFQQLYDEAIVSPAYGVWRIRQDKQVESNYLERFLRSPRALAYYKAKLRGTTARRRSLPQDVFLGLNVPLPPLPEQRRIAAILDKADAIRRRRRQAIHLTEDLARATFLHMFARYLGAGEFMGFREVSEVLVDCRNKTAPYANSGRPLIRTTNFRNNRLDLSDLKYVSEETNEIWSSRHQPSPGDIVYCREAPFGMAAAVPDGFFPCLGQRIMVSRPNKNVVSPQFLLHALNSSFVLRQAERVAVGATVKHLRVKDVEELQIPIPPMSEQQRFAELVTNTEANYQRNVAAQNLGLGLSNSLVQRAFCGEL